MHVCYLSISVPGRYQTALHGLPVHLNRFYTMNGRTIAWRGAPRECRWQKVLTMRCRYLRASVLVSSLRFWELHAARRYAVEYGMARLRGASRAVPTFRLKRDMKRDIPRERLLAREVESAEWAKYVLRDRAG
jgi:hypothetical protein